MLLDADIRVIDVMPVDCRDPSQGLPLSLT
jgi:hypothetical protein